MAAKMITDRRFLFRPPIPVKTTWILQKTPEFREHAKHEPALPGTRSCPGPGRHRVARLQQSVLWIRSLGRTPERASGDTWHRLPLL